MRKSTNPDRSEVRTGRTGTHDQRRLHPSMPEFAAATIDEAEIIQMAHLLADHSQRTTPVQLLEAQRVSAAEQLRIARERLIGARRRVAELERAVGHLNVFVDAARHHGPISA